MNTQEKLANLWREYSGSQKAESNDTSKKNPSLKTKFIFKDPVQNFKCAAENCPQLCCKNEGQKIRLLLQDIAVLIDNHLEDYIEGTFDTPENIARFIQFPSKENIYKTPYLKRKKGAAGNDECVFLAEDLRCSIWDKIPYICKTYPLIMEQEMDGIDMKLTFSLDTQCPLTQAESLTKETEKEYTQRLINSIVSERIEIDHTTKLLAYKRELLKKAGFAKYL